MNQSLNAQPKIFVAGSSWARGEWDPDRPVVLHDGIKQYFKDYGYPVVDTSQARSYHSRVINLLDKKLKEQYVENDIVLFIMADPLLDIIMPELADMHVKRSNDVTNLIKFTSAIEQAGGLVNLVRKQQDIIYSCLDAVAKKYNTQIHCIGGTYNVNTNILLQYTNLLPTVISWIDLLIGHFEEYKNLNDPNFGISYTWGIDYIDLSTYSTEFSQQVKSEFDVLSKNFYMLNELIFHPDGLHPNREGHKILFDYLVKTLQL